MAMQYIISSESAPMLHAWRKVKRADSAKQVLRDQVYNAIKANAGLDTQGGLDAMAKANAMEIRAPKRGQSLLWTVKVQHHIIKVLAIRV
jgi:hypothetical protein